MRRAAVLPAAGAALVCALALAACRAPAPRAPGALLPACPRDAHVDGAGRCACDPGDVPVLGACVPPSVADAYCGPVARASTTGACVFPACTAGDAVDIDAGCVPLVSLLHGGPSACGPGASLLVEDRRTACVPAGAACPRGTRARGDACVHPPACPPGTLESGGACRPVVLRGRAGGRGAWRIDVGAWAALVLGIDGGRASPELCAPLLARPLTWGLAPGEPLSVTLHIVLSAPDGDVSRVHVDVRPPVLPPSHPARALPPGAALLAERAVATLVEPLRGLGGEATASRVEVEVRCEAW